MMFHEFPVLLIKYRVILGILPSQLNFWYGLLG